MMDMATIPNKGGAFRRGLRGAAKGGVLVCLGVLVGLLAAGYEIRASLEASLIAGAFGAVMFFLGQVVARSATGALIGGTVVLLLGAAVGQRLGGTSYVVSVPTEKQTSLEMEITGPTLQGTEVSTRQLRGSIILVDFWATWCRPCVAELPNVKRVYELYHQDGFEVIGISLDNERQRLEQFIEEKHVPWPQIFYPEQKGWENPLAAKYRINAIPATFLLDRQGYVIANDLRGPQLEAIVMKLLGKRLIPIGVILGAVLGCLVGSVGGALVERNVRRQASLSDGIVDEPRPLGSGGSTAP
jgi:peroxiredoxin